MMDISDGLAGDLNHILQASTVGAKLCEEMIPRYTGVHLQQAMSDGEDFELLFTLPQAKARQLMKWQISQAPVLGGASGGQGRPKAMSFYLIGEITANAKQKIKASSHAHF